MQATVEGWTQGDGSLQDRLTLADWRRRMAVLYADVRSMAATDPGVALAHWRTVREWLFRDATDGRETYGAGR